MRSAILLRPVSDGVIIIVIPHSSAAWLSPDVAPQ
jgi:hypothetical protein